MAAATSAEQAPTQSAPASLAEIWERTLEYARTRTADAALVAELEFDGERNGVLLLRFVDATSATAAFIANDVKRIERVIQQAVGQRIRIELTTPISPSPAPQQVEVDAKIAENPVIIEAMGLFDATIHAVRSLSTEDSSKPATQNQPDGDSSDV